MGGLMEAPLFMKLIGYALLFGGPVALIAQEYYRWKARRRAYLRRFEGRWTR